MQLFANGAGLQILRSDRNWYNVEIRKENVEAGKEKLECLTLEFTVLVVNNAHEFWISQYPEILEFEINMHGLVSIDASKLGKVCCGVDYG